MEHEEKLAPPRHWTQPEDYLRAMARKRRFRRARQLLDHTKTGEPRMLLSTLPFLALLALLAVLSAAIMIVAFPGKKPAARPASAHVRQQGVAAPGWFQEAQKQFHK